MKGYFITIEGVDGAGKTTQLKLMQNWFAKHGYNSFFTREPGGTRVGEILRDILLNRIYTEITPVTEALLYAASRAQLVNDVIKPMLAEGRIVVCDRFVDSSTAYQAFGRGLPREFIREINRKATGGISPQLTLFLDLAPELRVDRMRPEGKQGVDRLEAESQVFYARVREGYLQIAREEPDRVKIISAQQSVQEVQEQIIFHVRQILELT